MFVTFFRAPASTEECEVYRLVGPLLVKENTALVASKDCGMRLLLLLRRSN
jgi:hypothetical protein